MQSLPALAWALPVFAAQGLLLVADEFVFHRRREIPPWERIGHPLDTLTVFVPFLLTVSLPPETPWTGLFVALAGFSCLFVAKDEWVHARLCGGGEQALHALLFLLHPLLFAAGWFLWKAGETGWLMGQCLVVGGFMVYQVAYWNIWKRSATSD
jgi:hypothetical protein